MQSQLAVARKVLEQAQQHKALHALHKARGIVVIRQFKGAWFFSGAIGRGVFLKRLPDGSWSLPVAIGVAQAGVGWQAGVQREDTILLLESESSVKAFESAGQLKVDADVGVSVGSGVSSKTGFAANHRTVTGSSAISITRGAFFGVSLEGAVVTSLAPINHRFYGSRKAKAARVLRGEVPFPAGRKGDLVLALHHALGNADAGKPVRHDLAGLARLLDEEKRLSALRGDLVAYGAQTLPLAESVEDDGAWLVAEPAEPLPRAEPVVEVTRRERSIDL